MAERRAGVLSNASLPWKFRDHGLFICFAPFDKPRYAAAVVIEHGGGSGAAYPIARDVLTFLYDKGKAMDVLAPLETAWGGTIEQRMAAAMQRYKEKVAIEEAIKRGEIALPPETATAGADGQ
jgi:penicillin-binding protein 2